MPGGCFALDQVGIDGVEQLVRQRLRVQPAGCLRDRGARALVDLAIERRQPRCQGRQCVVVAAARRDIVEQPVKADGAGTVQRLRDVFQALCNANRVDQHEAGFFVGVGRHLAQLRRGDRAGAAPFHLLEIERRLHVAQKDQHLQRLHVGAGGDHVDGDGDARVVVGAELPDQLLGIGAVGLVVDLLREIVAATEDLADDTDDLLGMVVVLAEDQSFRHLAAAGKQFAEKTIAIGFEHGADLVRHDYRAVELLRGVGEILVELLIALGPSALVADRNLVALVNSPAMLADIGANAIDFVGNVDPIRDRTLIGVLGDQIASEKAHRMQRWRCRQTDDERVEVFEHLTPSAIDRPVAFIGDDEVEALDRNVRVVAYQALLLACTALETRLLLVLFGQLSAGQQRIDALDRRDHDRGILVETGGPEPLDIVELGKRPAGAGRTKILELVPGLAHQVGAVGEEQNAPELRMLQQPMAEDASGVGLASAGRHLDQRARVIGRERGFEARHGIDLTLAQPLGHQWWHGLQPAADRHRGFEPSSQRLGAMEEEHAARARRRVGMIAKQDLGAGGDILEANLAFSTDQVLRRAPHIARGLVRVDHAAQRAADEQGIIDRAGVHGELANGHT